MCKTSVSILPYSENKQGNCCCCLSAIQLSSSALTVRRTCLFKVRAISTKLVWLPRFALDADIHLLAFWKSGPEKSVNVLIPLPRSLRETIRLPFCANSTSIVLPSPTVATSLHWKQMRASEWNVRVIFLFFSISVSVCVFLSVSVSVLVSVSL